MRAVQPKWFVLTLLLGMAAGANAKDELAPLILEGPFASLDAYCRSLEKSDAARCDHADFLVTSEGGEGGQGGNSGAGLPAPALEVVIFRRVTPATTARTFFRRIDYSLGIRTRRGWFVRADFASARANVSECCSLTSEASLPSFGNIRPGAPFRIEVTEAHRTMGARAKKGHEKSESVETSRWFLQCDFDRSSRPRCTPRILARCGGREIKWTAGPDGRLCAIPDERYDLCSNVHIDFDHWNDLIESRRCSPESAP